MLKRNKRSFAIVALLAMLFTMIPFAAFANTTTVLSRPTVDNDDNYTLGTVFQQITAGSMKVGDTATLSLPSDFKFMRKAFNGTESEVTQAQWNQESYVHNGTAYATPAAAVAAGGLDAVLIGDVYDGGAALTTAQLSTYKRNYFEFPSQYLGDNNALIQGGTGMDITVLAENQLKIELTTADPAAGLDSYMYTHVGYVYVDSGFTGDITATIDAPSGSGIPTGTITIGRVGTGEVTLESTDSPTFSDTGTTKFRIKESLAGDLTDKSDSVKLKLPNGFEWTGAPTVTVLWGAAKENNIAIADLKAYLEGKLQVSDDELTLDLPNTFTSTSALNFEVAADITVSDETKAKTGDINAKVTGKSSPATSEILVGKYGQYDLSIKAGDAPTIVSGMTDQIVATVTASESVKGSFTDGRTITLTLPSSAKWAVVDTDSGNGADVNTVSFPGTDGKTAKWTLNVNAGGTSDATDLDLKDMEVVVQPGFEGDLVAEVGGTAGLSGELTLAKVVKPVNITADTKPVIGIGQGAQEISDLTLTEVQAGAISDGVDLILDLPEGVRFAGTPKVEVTEGDLDIDEDNITTTSNTTDDNSLTIPIDGTSTTASTIKISGIKIMIDRTVPEGDVVVKVKGDAVGQVNNKAEVDSYFGGNLAGNVVSLENSEAYTLNADHKIFPNNATAAKAVVGTIGTPGEANTQVQFVISSTTYKVNGVEQTMDVAPYLKDGRTYLPVRYVAQSLGVADSNILWDAVSQKVTLIKGDKVVQMTIGSNIMLVNGVPVTMDVPAELTSDRTMLPFRFMAQAFGASVEWDDATQTVTMTL